MTSMRSSVELPMPGGEGGKEAAGSKRLVVGDGRCVAQGKRGKYEKLTTLTEACANMCP